ncbi:MAG: phosphate/phosphite/phosphonate ABC transporter substrate-binding protein [Chloroflexi bacterium]|nr:phosphate/phosphite/phosphonate ABC transporter substrate-binding protein [Chloroflexota bacterium]
MHRDTGVRALAWLAAVGLVLAACAPSAPVPARPAESKPAEAAKPAEARLAAPPVAPATSPAPPVAAPAASPAAPAVAASPAAAAPAPAQTGGAAPSTLRMAFVPSADSAKVLSSGKPLGDLLSKQVGVPVEVSVPTSYAAVIEAIGAGNLEIAWLAPLSYVLARQKYGADVILSSIRQGSKTYRAQIIAPADSPLKEVSELKGKRFAFVDSASASGFLYPSALLKDNGVDPKKDLGETVFAGGHDKVVIAVYNKQVDAGATFGDSTETGPPQDARSLVRSTLPDVMDRVRVLAKTEPIPNDTVSVRRGLPADLVAKIKAGLLAISATDEGKRQLKALYSIDGLGEASDRDYDGLRRVAQVVGLDLEEQIRPK